MDKMKWIIIGFMMLANVDLFSQAAMLVEDPMAIAQSASQFCEEMTVAGDQKKTLLLQMKEMMEQSKLLKANVDKYKKCMKWVKNARSAVALLDKTKKLKDNYLLFYEQVRKCDLLSKTERNNLVYNANLIVKESSEIYEEAKTIIGEFSEEGDAGLSSFERIQLLEKLGEKMDKMNDKINVIKSYVNNEIKKRERLVTLSSAVYNQYVPAQYHIRLTAK